MLRQFAKRSREPICGSCQPRPLSSKAATYTPFLAQMKNAGAVGLGVGLWLSALIGMTLKLALPGRFDRLAIVLCLLLGWSGAIVYDQFASALPSPSLWLLPVATRSARCSTSGRACAFKTRSGTASYCSGRLATIRQFSPA
jgi:hypothetical protein